MFNLISRVFSVENPAPLFHFSDVSPDLTFDYKKMKWVVLVQLLSTSLPTVFHMVLLPHSSLEILLEQLSLIHSIPSRAQITLRTKNEFRTAMN
jgi:hypothetical protein